MTAEEKETILQCAINTHGVLKQLDMLHEEMGELMTAINKMKRALPDGFVKQFDVIPYPLETTSVDYSLKYFNLCSEVADVRILLSQLERMLCKESIDISEDRKLLRLKDRLSKNTY